MDALKSNKLITSFLIWTLFNHAETFHRCGRKEKTPNFYMIQPCISSKMNILASSNIKSLESCQRFAQRNQGLAFSYLTEGIETENDYDDEDDDENEAEANCRVFDCPEFETTLSLQKTSSHHYYSLYARPLANMNVTCIPGIGIFILHSERKNYSEAVQICKGEGGLLASPCSERRTIHIAHIIASTGRSKTFDKWYVGLDDIEMEGSFVCSSGELLKCLQFRAWAPGEPHSRNGDDCVVINPRFTWQVVPCSKKLPFICEILPGGPLQLCSRISSLSEKKECLDNHINRTEFLEYNPKCKLPPGYLKNLTEMAENVEESITKMNSTS